MRCRSCGSTLLEPVLDLGEQPASDVFPGPDDPPVDPTWPLRLLWCSDCALVQLSDESATVPQAPRGIESLTMLEHATAAAGRLVSAVRAGPGTTVVEFDSHHGGSWLPALLSHGLVETAGGTVDLVVDVHGLVHDDDTAAALAERVARVAPGGRFALEFHHLLALVEGGQFDTVRHGHPVYLSLLALQPALARLGMRVIAAHREDVFGGSLVVVAARADDVGAAEEPSVSEVLAAERAAGLDDPTRLRALQQRAERSGAALRAWLEEARAQGRTVLGYGAPSKAAVLLTWAGVGRDLLPFTADLSPAKHGCVIPGARVPIRSPEDLVAAAPEEVLVLTWDIVDEVRAQLAPEMAPGTRFVVPQPEPHVQP